MEDPAAGGVGVSVGTLSEMNVVPLVDVVLVLLIIFMSPRTSWNPVWTSRFPR